MEIRSVHMPAAMEVIGFVVLSYNPRHTTWRMAYNQLVRRGEKQGYVSKNIKLLLTIFIRFIYIKHMTELMFLT
jgi:hypothetical protein